FLNRCIDRTTEYWQRHNAVSISHHYEFVRDEEERNQRLATLSRCRRIDTTGRSTCGQSANLVARPGRLIRSRIKDRDEVDARSEMAGGARNHPRRASMSALACAVVVSTIAPQCRLTQTPSPEKAAAD